MHRTTPYAASAAYPAGQARAGNLRSIWSSTWSSHAASAMLKVAAAAGMEDEGGEDGGGRGRFRPMGGDASHAGEPEWRMSDSTRRWKSEALMLVRSQANQAGRAES